MKMGEGEQRPLNFLVATDMHVGHRSENLGVQHDSYVALEEVLATAREKQVDFLLLGGDLFDEVNPAKDCYHRTLAIMSKYVMAGERHSPLEVTYEGQPWPVNFNQGWGVSLPVFTIHGNHDFPNMDNGRIGSCDLLQQAHFLNYFGRHMSHEEIIIKPLIISKRRGVRLALYGLGYIKDIVLAKMFGQGRVKFEPLPKGDGHKYYSIFILHQNRGAKAGKVGAPAQKSIHPENIPEWIDLTIWGHEHEAFYDVFEDSSRRIMQPGSTVITSCIEAEAKQKQCVLMELGPRKGDFTYYNILLEKSYRPLALLEYEYSQLQETELGANLTLKDFICQQIEKALAEHNSKKPIIRVRLESTDFHDHYALKKAVEERFRSRVANPNKILIMWKEKAEKGKMSMPDKEFQRKFQTKEGFKNPQNQMRKIQSLGEHLNNSIKELASVEDEFFSPKFLFELTMHIPRQDCSKAEVKSQLKKYADRKLAHELTELRALEEKYERESVRATRYLDDQLRLLSGEEVDYAWWGVRNQREFEQLGKDIMSYDDLNKMADRLENYSRQDMPENPFEYNLQPGGVIDLDDDIYGEESLIKRQYQLHTEEEDCCERAARTEPDEDLRRINFQQAQAEAKKQDQFRKKMAPARGDLHRKKMEVEKPPPPQKKEEGETKRVGIRVAGRPGSDPKKIKKQVRFSDDFM